ncbi:uncharacterized protein DNG_04472 [Cephalotrichum gorgonifer]|uniref:Uncharacterized protein n=1 Tax=Cephalotrichum gorgonifer TaxID=2041049 RepID=A0AAE8SUY8_9PEZI|nr:uncharacterized protein DNG_04472 [Cephalotrichum gorgonifer]
MMAIVRSGSIVPNLNIYGNTIGCSVPSYDICVLLPGLVDAGFEAVGMSVESLTLSFSTRVDHGWNGWLQAYGVEVGEAERVRQRQQWQAIFDEEEYVMSDEEDGAAEQDVNSGDESDDQREEEPGEGSEEEGDCDDGDDEDDAEFDKAIERGKGSEIRGRYGDNYAQVLCRDNFPGIAKLLLHMPNLQSLDLHMYQTLQYESYGGGSMLHNYTRVFGALVKQGVVLPQLRRLVLRGICVHGQDLVRFAEQQPQLEDVELRQVFLEVQPGIVTDWGHVLKDMAAKSSRLARLYLSDLCHLGRSPSPTAIGWSFYQANLLCPGESLREEWITQEWGSECACGKDTMLWTRELSLHEIRDPRRFDFAKAGKLMHCSETPSSRLDIGVRHAEMVRDICGRAY